MFVCRILCDTCVSLISSVLVQWYIFVSACVQRMSQLWLNRVETTRWLDAFQDPRALYRAPETTVGASLFSFKLSPTPTPGKRSWRERSRLLAVNDRRQS